MNEEYATTNHKQPVYEAFQVVAKTLKGNHGKWVKIGAAFEHKDGHGMTLVLECPVIITDEPIIFRTPN